MFITNLSVTLCMVTGCLALIFAIVWLITSIFEKVRNRKVKLLSNGENYIKK